MNICILVDNWKEHLLVFNSSILLITMVNMIKHRQKSSGAEGERLKEATNINKSLSTLGFVLYSLTFSHFEYLFIYIFSLVT